MKRTPSAGASTLAAPEFPVRFGEGASRIVYVAAGDCLADIDGVVTRTRDRLYRGMPAKETSTATGVEFERAWEGARQG